MFLDFFFSTSGKKKTEKKNKKSPNISCCFFNTKIEITQYMQRYICFFFHKKQFGLWLWSSCSFDSVNMRTVIGYITAISFCSSVRIFWKINKENAQWVTFLGVPKYTLAVYWRSRKFFFSCFFFLFFFSKKRVVGPHNIFLKKKKQ